MSLSPSTSRLFSRCVSLFSPWFRLLPLSVKPEPLLDVSYILDIISVEETCKPSVLSLYLILTYLKMRGHFWKAFTLLNLQKTEYKCQRSWKDAHPQAKLMKRGLK